MAKAVRRGKGAPGEAAEMEARSGARQYVFSAAACLPAGRLFSPLPAVGEGVGVSEGARRWTPHPAFGHPLPQGEREQR